MKSLQILMVCLAMGACSKGSEGAPWSLKRSKIISVSPTLPACGVFYSLVEMELESDRHQSKVIYLPCVEVIGGPLPKVGTFCSAKGKMESVSGSIVNGLIGMDKPVRVTRELVCDGKTYVFDL